MFYDVLPKTPTDVDTLTVDDVTSFTSRNKTVSIEDPGAGTNVWVYEFYINNSGHLGYKKSTDNGATFGSFQTIDSVPATYVDVAVWFDRWTKGGTGNIIHIVGANTTDQGLRYFQLDTNNSDTISGDLVALTSTTLNSTDANASICISWDGTVYVACTFTTTAGIRMAESSTPTSSWTDRGLVTNSSNSADAGKLVPAKTDDDVMMYMVEFAGTDTFTVARWDAIGHTWSIEDNSTIPVPTGEEDWDVVHDPVDGDSYVVIVSVVGTDSVLSEMQTFFYDESAGTVTLRGTHKINAQTGNSHFVEYPRLALDTNNNTIICAFLWGTAASKAIQMMCSYDGARTFGDPCRIMNGIASDDYRYVSTCYHVIDEAIGFHVSWFNDDLNDLHALGYVADRITGNVKDNSDVNAANVDVLIFSVSPDNSFNRTYQGRAISDASGNWSASIIDLDDSNVEIQVIYDEDLANDEVDVSHRVAVDSI